MLTELGALAAVVLLACISPGPDFVAVSSAALHSRKAAVRMALGIAFAVFLWAVLTVIGFGVIMESMPALFDIIRIIGGGYLIYLGVKIIHSALTDHSGDLVRSPPVAAPFRQGFIVSITNPKTAAFFGSLFFTLLPPGASAAAYIAAVFLVTAITVGWMLTVAMLFSGVTARSFYQRARRPIDAIMGTVLVALGIRLTVAR